MFCEELKQVSNALLKNAGFSERACQCYLRSLKLTGN